MEDLRKFNVELGDWLEGVKLDFEENKLQKQMFRIITEKGAIDSMSDDEKLIVKKMLENMMRLSLIINNSPLQTDKLIQYLQ